MAELLVVELLGVVGWWRGGLPADVGSSPWVQVMYPTMELLLQGKMAAATGLPVLITVHVPVVSCAAIMYTYRVSAMEDCGTN